MNYYKESRHAIGQLAKPPKINETFTVKNGCSALKRLHIDSFKDIEMIN